MSGVKAELDYQILSVDTLKPNLKNPNKMDDKRFELLVNNIKRFGFLDPIIVRKDPDGFIIVDGEHRWKALKKLGFSHAPCVITDLGEEDGLINTLMLNRIKGRLDPERVGAIIMGMREEYSQKDLVDITGYSSQDLENYASILEIPELPDLGKFNDLRFFAYPGGKYHVRNKILGILPDHHIFVEVFGGAAHILLNKPQSKVEVYNDLDGELVNLFEVVRNRFNEFKLKSKFLLYSRELQEKFSSDEKPEDTIERAVRFFFLIKSSFNAFVKDGGSFRYGRLNNLAEEFSDGFEDLEEIWHRLQTVTIENLDFRQCINRYDSDNTVFFLDPPYFGINYYTKEFSEKDHEDLYKLLTGAVLGRWVLTYNNHPWVREHYRGFEWRLASSILSMPLSQEGEGRIPYNNLVIMNFNPDEVIAAKARDDSNGNSKEKRGGDEINAKIIPP